MGHGLCFCQHLLNWVDMSYCSVVLVRVNGDRDRSTSLLKALLKAPAEHVMHDTYHENTIVGQTSDFYVLTVQAATCNSVALLVRPPNLEHAGVVVQYIPTTPCPCVKTARRTPRDPSPQPSLAGCVRWSPRWRRRRRALAAPRPPPPAPSRRRCAAG